MKARSIKKDIAIIGMSGKFPKSENIMEFWKNLVEGNELIHIYTDSELEELGINPDLIKNKKYIKSSSLLEDAGSFDYSFFGYTKEEAELMDPQIRVIHEQVWLSLEDSGYNPFNYPSKIGCFLASSDNLNWRAHVKLLESGSKINPFLIAQLSNRNTMSTLVSYALNLKGPSYFVDTACSSSLVAVHIACRSLLMKECSMAIAGGASIGSSTGIGYMHEEGMIYSKDGHCKAFDIDSSGTVGGEGVGVVVLKRLEDALNDRDHIYSIIRSSSANNDGNRKVGYTAPSVTGQYECIKTAHQIAEVDPRDISYIETHGTATKLGDPVEIEALNKSFNYDTSFKCSIGSLKTNIGHLDAAAGVAGLIKTALSLKNKVIPPSLHFKEPNPEINFKSGPFQVNSKLKEWVSEKPLLSGVSSFGIGGTNAHVILEEPPVQSQGSAKTVCQLIVYSAKTRSSLERQEDRLRDFLMKNKEVDLADLAYTLKTGRSNYKYRKFVICEDNNDAVDQFNKVNFPGLFQVKEKKGIVFMFSGQGSQYYEMGKQIYLQYPYFKSIMDEGFSILKNETGVDYADVIGYSNFKGAESNLINDTCYTQPLLFLLEYAFAKFLLKLGVKPSNMIGHSLGEYVAACISEVFTFEEGLKLIVKRAQLMSGMENGSMLSIDLAAKEVIQFMAPDVSIAAINTESSCVISGSTRSIDAISKILSSKEISFAELKTSHAFHSQMMAPILDAYETELNKIDFSNPKYPFISCTTGVTIKNEEAVSPKYWVNHLRDTVNFSKGLDSLLKEDHSAYIEIGSAKVLLNFLKQNKKYNPGLVLTSLMKHPKETRDDSYFLLNALGTLWSSGTTINWNEYYTGELRNKISAPTYSFDKIIFPSKVDPVKSLAELSLLNGLNDVREDYSEWIYEQGWKELKNEAFQRVSFAWTLCFLNDNDFSEKLKDQLIKGNESVVFVKKGAQYLSLEDQLILINPSDIKDYELLSSEIAGRFKGPGRIIHAWSVEDKGKFESSTGIEALNYFSLLNIARTFLKKKSLAPIRLDFLVADLFKVSGNEQISAAKSIALAALKVIPKEYEHIFCRCIEFLMEDFENNVSYRESLFSKLNINTKELTLALRGNKTWTPFYEKIKVDKELVSEGKLKVNGVYVVTGANGGIGKTLASFLANEYNASLILIGRGERNKALMDKLKKENNAVYYIQDDLSDLDILKNKVNTLMITSNAKVDGVFHAAGLGDYSGLIEDRTKEDCERIFLPKIKGTNNLVDVFKESSPDFFVLCSSISSVLAPFGQVAYVAANLYQNFFALEKDSKTKIVSIQWDAWKEVGMAVKANKRHGNKNENEILSLGINNKDGIEAFKYALNSKSSEIIVSVRDFNSSIFHSDKYTLKNALETAEASVVTNDIEVERPDIKSLFKEARSETEKIMTELWKSIFGYEKIGINDNFFELGGDSLKVMTLIKRIHKSFNVEISINDFFKRSSIEELAKEIDLALEFKELNSSGRRSTMSNQIRL